ncbi:242_t:CDS:1, partial [Acaulospora morrowiae]
WILDSLSYKNNTNVNNSDIENPEQNIGVYLPPIETSSLQLPPYLRNKDAIIFEARNETQNNMDGNSIHNVDYTNENSSGNLDNLTDVTSALNLTAL